MKPKLYYDENDPHLPVEVYSTDLDDVTRYNEIIVATFYHWRGPYWKRLEVAQARADKFVAEEWRDAGFWPMLVEFIYRLAVYYNWSFMARVMARVMGRKQ